jgi:hypothetical protein
VSQEYKGFIAQKGLTSLIKEGTEKIHREE